MKRGKRRSRILGPRKTLEELALERDWFTESLRLVNDQFMAIEEAKRVPLPYLKKWARSKRSA